MFLVLFAAFSEFSKFSKFSKLKLQPRTYLTLCAKLFGKESIEGLDVSREGRSISAVLPHFNKGGSVGS